MRGIGNPRLTLDPSHPHLVSHVFSAQAPGAELVGEDSAPDRKIPMRPLHLTCSLPALVLALTTVASPVHAQNLTVTGTVTSPIEGALGAPRSGVVVQIKETNIAVLTSTAGTYSINLRSPSDTLVFRVLGFESQELPVAGRSVQLDGQTVLNVELVPVSSPRDMTISVVPFRAQQPPGEGGEASDCLRTFSPMPGSAYDPNWRSGNPGLAKLLFQSCDQQGGSLPQPRTIPRGEAGEPVLDF